MNIPNVRIESGLELHVRLKDNGVSLDWSSLQGVKALMYSVEQKAVAGAAEVAIDNENPQILIVKYHGSSPQYTGLAKLIVRCDYNGKQKTYDTVVSNFVETTDEATGVIVLDDPTISVGISVEDVSTSLLDEAINAAFAAAEDAIAAAQAATDAASGVIAATDNANEAASLAREAAQSVEAVKTAAQDATKAANNAAELATKAANETSEKLSSIISQELGSDETKTVSQNTITKALATKQDTLIPGNGISIEGNVISATVGGGGNSPIDLSDYAKKADVSIALEKKQDTISDLETIREGAALGKTALQKHQDISGLATKEEVAGKQNIISDLASIREGARKGATALQSYTESDPVYMADKPNIALKAEIPDISGKADKTTIVTETEGNASYAILPNVLTKLGTLASAVTLSLDTSNEESGVTNVYDIVFTTPADAPSITWPEGISWVGGSAPAIAGGKTYEVSIMDNLATYGEY